MVGVTGIEPVTPTMSTHGLGVLYDTCMMRNTYKSNQSSKLVSDIVWRL
jgi:hypothetical protein